MGDNKARDENYLMRCVFYLFLLVIPVAILVGCNADKKESPEDSPAGKIDYLNNIQSQHVTPRNVEVWLPRQYFQNPQARFPVLYMHDGQNLFNSSSASYGVAWEADDTAQKLIDAGKIKPFIIVGIWNTRQRTREYFPEKAANYFTADDLAVLEQIKEPFGEVESQEYIADEYLQFIVKELKPKIDASYRILGDKPNTWISGSSMGGLISMYALAEYPDVFGKAACVSTHWPILMNNDNILIANSIRNYMVDKLPSAGSHQIYYDFGTETLDQYYEVHQVKVDAIMRDKGYVEGKDWVTKKFPGAEHNEQSWQDRMDVILTFLSPH